MLIEEPNHGGDKYGRRRCDAEYRSAEDEAREKYRGLRKKLCGATNK